MAGVTLFVITASLALQLDEDQNNDMRRRRIARSRKDSKEKEEDIKEYEEDSKEKEGDIKE